MNNNFVVLYIIASIIIAYSMLSEIYKDLKTKKIFIISVLLILLSVYFVFAWICLIDKLTAGHFYGRLAFIVQALPLIVYFLYVLVRTKMDKKRRGAKKDSF